MNRSTVRLLIVEHALLGSDKLSDSRTPYRLGLLQIESYVPRTTAAGSRASAAATIAMYVVTDE
jgi:hypothetical protein